MRDTPNPAPARDAKVYRIGFAHRDSRDTVTITLIPERVRVIDFYPLVPSLAATRISRQQEA